MPPSFQEMSSNPPQLIRLWSVMSPVLFLYLSRRLRHIGADIPPPLPTHLVHGLGFVPGVRYTCRQMSPAIDEDGGRIPTDRSGMLRTLSGGWETNSCQAAVTWPRLRTSARRTAEWTSCLACLGSLCVSKATRSCLQSESINTDQSHWDVHWNGPAACGDFWSAQLTHFKMNLLPAY